MIEQTFSLFKKSFRRFENFSGATIFWSSNAKSVKQNTATFGLNMITSIEKSQIKFRYKVTNFSHFLVL